MAQVQSCDMGGRDRDPEWFEEHRDFLVRFCRHFGRDDIVDDLVQNTLIKGNGSAEAKTLLLSGDTIGLRKYLCTIAKNDFIDTRRREKTAEKNEDAVVRLQKLRERDLSPEHEAIWKDAARILSECLSSLPKDSRDVLELRYSFDKTNKEIAELLGVPEGTVGSKISRARAELRKCEALREALRIMKELN